MLFASPAWTVRRVSTETLQVFWFPLGFFPSVILHRIPWVVYNIEWFTGNRNIKSSVKSHNIISFPRSNGLLFLLSQFCIWSLSVVDKWFTGQGNIMCTVKNHTSYLSPQVLPKSNGLLEATVAQLPTWRRENHIYPVLTWPLFAEAVRSKVNPLASDDHIKLLVEQLQLMGEVREKCCSC